jgi:hypothetical protein
MLRSRPPSTATRTLLGILAVAALAIGGPAAPSAAQDGGFEAYVATTALNLRAGPGTKTNIVGILLKYDRITVLEQTRIGRATWYSIEASGGYTNGWVNARYVEFGQAPAGIFPEGPVDYGKPETPTLIKGAFKYQGASACRECHLESTGSFHLGASRVWEHHVHSSAYKTLKREYTKEIARRTRGIDDPLGDWRCVKCHTTAYGADQSQLASTYSNEEGVTCEVCHGPSSGYANEDHGPKAANREAMGFHILKDLPERRKLCTSCHNPASPTYVPFNLREFSRDIAHWVDPGDPAYYADARAEAARRDAEVERARQAKAEKEVAERKQREAEAAAAAATAAAAAQSAAEREAAEQKQAAEEEAEKKRLAALSAKQKEEEAARAAEAARAEAAAEAAEAAAEAKRMEEQERQAAEAAKQKAEADLAQQKAEESDRARKAEAARKKAEDEARAAAAKSTGIERYLEDVDDVVILNTDGVKYNSVEFAHLAHASNQYMPDGECQTCHHTQEGDESPEACSECHEIGGDADEEKKKTRSVHQKNLKFPKPEDQEQVSCVGCHKSQNQLLEMGKRTGEKAPTKCTLCHTRKR